MAGKSTFVQGADFIEGTVSDIIGKGEKSRLRINGTPAGQPELSVLARLGIATEVGTADRPEGTRGPKPKILRIPTNVAGMTVARR